MSIEQDRVATPAAAPSKVVSFLARRDVPCPACGYNLRGVTKEACPECAMPLTMEDLRGKGPVMKHWMVPTLLSVVVINLLLVLLPRALVAIGVVRGTPPDIRYDYVVAYIIVVGVPTLNWFSNRRTAWTRWRVRPNQPLDRWLPHILITMAAIAGASLSISLNWLWSVLYRLSDLVLRDPLGAAQLTLASVQCVPIVVCYIALCMSATQDRVNTWARRSIISIIATLGIIALLEGAMHHMY